LTSDQFRAGMGPDTRRQVCNPRRLLPEDFTDDLVYTFGSILLPDGLIYVCLVNGSWIFWKRAGEAEAGSSCLSRARPPGPWSAGRRSAPAHKEAVSLRRTAHSSGASSRRSPWNRQNSGPRRQIAAAASWQTPFIPLAGLW